jgi:large subunit ribosomal protein L35
METARQGMPWRFRFASSKNSLTQPRRATAARLAPHLRCADRRAGSTESQMPKLKTKSGAKKRFKMTGTGKVKAAAQGKRHGMIKRHAKFIRTARGTMVLDDSDAKIVKKYMPYAR